MTTQEIKDEILAKIQATRARGARDIIVRSGELQKVWGLKNKLPPICDAMKSLFRPGDSIQELPKTRASGRRNRSTPMEPLSNNNPAPNNIAAAGWRLFI